MLYDPKWETKTKPDIYALPTLIAWLERFPANKEYDFNACNGTCLLDQYLDHSGIIWTPGGPRYCELDKKTGWGFQIACPHPRTYGAALARAQALCNERAGES